MKIRMIYLILFVSGLLATQTFKAQDAPIKAKDRPTKFQKMQDMMPLEVKSTDPVLGSPWIVFSDRPDNPTFDNAGSAVEKKKAQFLQKFIITETNGKFAHIYQDGNFGLQTWELSETAIDYGWINMSNLLISSHCLVTKKSEIALKCMVLNTLGSIQNEKAISNMDHEVVYFFADPGLTKKTGDNSQLFQILYVYKIHRVAGKPFSVLVGMSSKVGKAGDESEIRTVIKGWVDYNRLTLWDTRLAVEPNSETNAAADRKQKSIKATVFTSSDKALEFKQGAPINNRFILWNNDSFEVRRIGDWRRFPILDTMPGLYKVGCMGDIKDSSGMAKILSLDEDAAIKREHGFLQQSKRVINIVFVVDGTSSMGPYYQSSIVPAIQEIIQQLNKYPSKNTVRFGGVVYRDAAEGSRLVETKSLTEKAKVDEVITFFKKIDARDYTDTSKAEAVYFGLKTALRSVIQNPYETNIVILIGDAGNHFDSDKTFVDEKSLISLMADRQIWSVVFQVHNGPQLTYDDFNTQTKKLILETGKILYNKNDSIRSVAKGYDQGNVYWAESTKGSNVWELKNAAYYCSAIYASKGETKSTALLKEEIVKTFVKADEYTNTLIVLVNQIVEDGNSFKQTVDNVEEINIRTKGGPGASLYADVYGPGLIEYFRNLNIPKETVEKLFQERWQFYLEGYVPTKVNNLKEPPFTKALLYSAEEFSRMYEILNKLDDARNSSERRERLEATWREVLSDYIGIDRQTAGEMTIGEATNMLFGIPSPQSFINQVKINDISDASILNDENLAYYCMNIYKKSTKLKEILDAIRPKEVFVTNNVKYYWILESYIP